MPLATIDWDSDACVIIDQTLLPIELKFLRLTTIEEVWEAIKVLRVRGAPAIGIAAAFGLYLGVKDCDETDKATFLQKLSEAKDFLAASRPTAVNLFWALERVQKLVEANAEQSVAELKALMLNEARLMIEEDNRVCRAIGEYGETLLRGEGSVLTHCNAGGLATASYGTALAPIYIAQEKGRTLHVFAGETRPLLQGARLTAWECAQNGIPCTLICDVASGSVLASKKIQAVLVGADRVTASGDFANKIGTYNLAVLAKHHGVPFYVAAPLSSIDMTLERGEQIPIEERDAGEVTNGFGRRTAPEGIGVYNPAFDVTPHELVTAFITERGIVRPPFAAGFRKIFHYGKT